MKTESLRSVTLATIENYRAAANQATRAYRLGSRRLITAVNAGLEKNIDTRTAKLVPQVVDAMVGLRGRMSDAMFKGIDQVSTRTEQVVDLGTDGVVRQVSKVADFADGVANPTLANGLQTAARLSLPVAKMGLTVSGKLVDGAKALSNAAKGEGVVKRATRASTKASTEVVDMVSDVAAKAGKTATRATRQVKGQVKAQTAKVVSQAKAAARAAAPKKAAPRAKRKLAA
ncbi:MAG: hypothetical protein IPP87_22675 [Ideonella sp.]|nr:hypothetical protein [Ideonella sp.]MBL0151305.1 hypothetical protein [Ideonella sp.]